MKVSGCELRLTGGLLDGQTGKPPLHSPAFAIVTETSDSLSYIITYQNPLVILTLKIILSQMSIPIRGNVDSFKVKASVFWFENLCGVSTHRPCSDVSLSLASDGGQWTAQGFYAI